MTRAPFVLPRASEPFARESGVADTRLGWRLVSPLMQELYPPIPLGETAENVAERYGVSRERQDEVALRSHQRAARARDAGRFGDEIVPVPTGAGVVSQDEGIRPGLTLEELAAQQGVQPIEDFQRFLDEIGDVWPDEESADEFIAWLRRSRRVGHFAGRDGSA